MPTIILYTRANCELCEQAEILFEQVNADRAWQLAEVDIDHDAALRERYGWSIPVLKREDNSAELKWPFPVSRLRAFLQAPVSGAK